MGVGFFGGEIAGLGLIRMILRRGRSNRAGKSLFGFWGGDLISAKRILRVEGVGFGGFFGGGGAG